MAHREGFPDVQTRLQARPIYHHIRESIEAHLSVAVAAMAVSHWIEVQTGWSIKNFVRTARRYRTVRINAGGQTLTAALVGQYDPLFDNLLSKRAKALHLGPANYCWFTDPSRALCLKLAGTPTADRPMIGMCDSARCPQATHHQHHRPVWAEHAERTKTFLGQLGKTRTTERARLQADYDRALRVITNIESATGTSATEEQA